MILRAGHRWSGVALALALLLACAPNEARPPAPGNAAGPPSPRPPAAAATAVPREAVRVSYSSVDASQIPVWVAQDAGFFQAAGLDVELVFIESGSKALQTLLPEVAADRPDARRLRYEDLVDDRFVRALEESGFIGQLYGGE